DGNYSHEAIVNRTNSELANDLGNLAQRSLSMVGKHCGARVPTPGAFTEADTAILTAANDLLPKVRTMIDRQELHGVLAAIIAVVSEANRYFAGQEPWALRKSDPARMETVLFVTAEILRRVAILLQPFVPESAGKLLDILGVGPDARTFNELTPDVRLVPGADLPAPQPIFPRFVDAEDAAS
ncbi:MAG: methionine--tRNA ligase, partial [Aurantimonas coralicida]|nr:methionine--tRNA ligase [Aurantimonas coralicida]